MKRKISVIGLGYVGLPLAVAFAKKTHVIAFDIKASRIEDLKRGVDSTNEVVRKDLDIADLYLTLDSEDLKKADFHIVAVPTPIDNSNQPNLLPLHKASQTVGGVLKRGDIVVYESTVYPGVTEEECIPILECLSGLKCGIDFHVGYSPERINPGDKEHTFSKITKVVAALNSETLKILSSVYSSVVEAGVFEASSIKVAEAAKVIENAQRDINVAFVNELKIIFDKMNIDIFDVLEAAKTKWNFLDFTPGLVGGHCIGVDPYYLSYKAEQVGHKSEVILSGRQVNDSMGKYIAQEVIKKMIQNNIHVHGAKVGIFGFTFKENCPDFRNTRVTDIIAELKSYCIDPLVHDPLVNNAAVMQEHGVEIKEISCLQNCEVIVLAVAHDAFLDNKVFEIINRAKVLVDIKNQAKKISDFSVKSSVEVT